mmetsp:Transcript_21606/g.44583  ORF Transcript_21606/g.44583 Transcript_21606/m.44583 type:complete len:271 (-) Transcript_21606:618-1430(-)
MLRNTLQRQPLPWILLQQLGNQILGIFRHPTRPPNIHSRDSPIRHCLRLGLKGRTSHQKLVQQHPQRPRVHLLIVLLSLDHLRGKVVQRPAHGVPPRSRRVHTPPEIRNLDIVVRPEKQILRLDIPVNDVLRMAVTKRLTEIANELGRRPLRKPPLGSEPLVQLSARTVLQNQIDVLIVVEIAVHPQDVLVPQMRLDFDLAAQLVFAPVAEELRFREAFEGHDVFGASLAGQVDFAEFAAAEGLADFEVVDRPAAARGGEVGGDGVDVVF